MSAAIDPQAGAQEEKLSEAVSRMESSSRAYARWLNALAQIENPDQDDDEFVKATFVEERKALRVNSSSRRPVPPNASGPSWRRSRQTSYASTSQAQRKTRCCCSAWAQSKPIS